LLCGEDGTLKERPFQPETAPREHSLLLVIATKKVGCMSTTTTTDPLGWQA